MKFFATYNKKWLVYVVSFFVFFASVLLIIQYRHERSIRIEALNDELNNYTGLVERYIQKYHVYESKVYTTLDTLNDLIPGNTLRITIIAPDGVVWYDSQVEDVTTMENHLHRPEVQQSLREEYGTDIRVSATTNIKYYYYSQYFERYFIRVSVLYDIEARQFIQPDMIFILTVVLILLITTFSIVLITDKFGKSIDTLKEFTIRALANKPIEGGLVFPNNELGSIGQEIIDIYKKLSQTKEDLLSEREKLIRHLDLLDEGIAIFSKDKHVITSNNHFMQFVNHISDSRVLSAEGFFEIEDFRPLFGFINENIHNDKENPADGKTTFEISISKSGKYYIIRSIVFQDKSFEVSIQDATKPAKRKRMKQELTENIAHELKTPVSSVKGLLETILESNPKKEKTIDFLRRAYAQSCRLTDLINDISLLTKIEEAGSLYKIESVDIQDIITEIKQEIKSKLDENNIKLEISLDGRLVMNGNPVLLYSIFRNLIDNAVSYGGSDSVIYQISEYRI